MKKIYCILPLIPGCSPQVSWLKTKSPFTLPFLSCLSMVGGSFPAASQNTFLETFGSFGFETGLDGVVTSDGQYVLAGSVTNGYLLTGNTDDGNSFDLFVAKTNSDGFSLNPSSYDTILSFCPVSAWYVSTGDIFPAVSSLNYTDTTEVPFVSNAANTIGHAGNQTMVCLTVGMDEIQTIYLWMNVYPNPATKKNNNQLLFSRNRPGTSSVGECRR